MARSVVPIHGAHATLISGCNFIRQHPVSLDGAPGSQRRNVQNRLIANRLREMDCFLIVLLEGLASHIDGANHDGRRFARLSNSAKKLRVVEHMLGSNSTDDAWLRAIGGVVARLHRTKEGLPLLMVAADENPFLSLCSIAEFYRDIGSRLIHKTSHLAVSLTPPPKRPI